MKQNSVRRYLGVFLALVVLLVVWLLSPSKASDAVRTIGFSLREMLLVIPPVFVLLGLLDVWVSRERLIRYMGAGSGGRGTAIAFIMGSVAAGPLYAAFPIALVLVRKGCSLFNLMTFIGAWSTTKVPMFLFEYSALGAEFAITRLAANIPAILLISLVISRIVPEQEYERLAIPES
ncbi:MAG: permease [Spirochaetales bacterium]|jgi:uncharacterized membrane protein YraQ (UPF0718 family)|nr:permease [Spirochaetales bacterium]